MELLALARLRAIAAAGDDQRQGALRVGQAEMECRKAAHRDADDMGFLDGERVEDGANVVARPVLRIAPGVLRHVGGRIPAGVVGDASITPPEIPHLPLVTAIVVGEFVDKHDRGTTARLLVIKADTVIGRQVWHRDFPFSNRPIRHPTSAGARPASRAPEAGQWDILRPRTDRG